MMVSQHAQQQLKERLPGADPDALWKLSRTADQAERVERIARLAP